MDYYSGRVREEREKLGLSQAAAAAACGVRRQMWVRYEAGEATPKIGVMSAFARAGADVLYIVTGRRESAEPELTDRERLEVAVEAIVEGLAARRLRPAPDKLAELILVAYDVIGEQPLEEARPRILKLVRAA